MVVSSPLLASHLSPDSAEADDERIPSRSGTHLHRTSSDEYFDPVARNDASSVSRRRDFTRGVSAAYVVGPGIYHFGIIDILQEFDWKKKGEFFFKYVFRCHCADWHRLSVVDSSLYVARFMRMVRRVYGVPLDSDD